MYRHLILILSLILTISISPTRAQSKKIAILIGIGRYAPGTRWNALSSVNDVSLLRGLLLNQGFRDTNIVVLLDSEATQAKIIAAFELVQEKISAGDIFFFHFSGHGQQLFDDNADESDGLDEAIVPYDAPMKFIPGQKEKHIRDDYLNSVLSSIRRKEGASGQVVVSLDACHSGSGTRGLTKNRSVARGTNVVYGERNFRFQSSSEESMGLGEKNAGYSPMACFYGSGPQELNYQYSINNNQVGSLSYAFSRAIEMSDSTASCRDVFNRIRSLMMTIAPAQTPQAEGELDKKMFNGTNARRKNYFNISSIINDSVVRVNGGLLQGIVPLSKVVVCKPNASDTSAGNILMHARVTTVDLAESEIILDRRVNIDSLQFAEVYAQVRKRPFTITVDISQLTTSRQWMKEILKNQEIVAFQESNPQLSFAENNSQLLLRNPLGDTISVWNKAGDLKLLQSLIADRIEVAALSLFYKSMNTPDSDLKLVVEMIHINVDADGNEVDGSPIEIENTTVQPSLSLGSSFRLKIKNEGIKKAYFAILDIQPNDTFNIVVPYKGEDPSSFSIEPLAEFKTRTIGIGKPLGKETLKVIASTLPINYLPISARGSGDAYKILDPEYRLNEHSAMARGADRMQVFTVTIPFIIKAN